MAPRSRVVGPLLLVLEVKDCWCRPSVLLDCSIDVERCFGSVVGGEDVVVAINRPFERIFVLHLLERRRVLVVGVSLSLYELRMLVDWRSGLGESVALSLHDLHVLSSAKARVGGVDEVGRWTAKDACC